MRLPVIQYGETQSFGRRDPMDPVRIASAEARALANASDTMAGISQTLSRRQNDIEYRRNTTKFMTEHMNWVEKNAGKEYYTAEELPADLPFARTEKVVDEQGNLVEVPREQIPAYEVYPTLYGKMLNSLVDSFSGSFTNSDVEAEWLEEARQKAVGSIANAKLNAIEKQRVFGIKQTVSFKNRALDAQKYDLARELIKGNPDLEPDDARAYLDEIDEREETDRYELLLTNLHEDGLRAALDYLTKTDTYDGALEPHEARAYASVIRGALTSLQVGRKSLAKEQEAELKYDVNNIIDVLKKGERVHPATLSVAQAQIKDVDTVLARKLNLAIDYSDLFHQLAVFPVTKQQANLEEIEKIARTRYENSAEAGVLVTWLKEGLSKIQASIANDQIAFWNDIATESIPELDVKNIGESLAQRKTYAKAIANNWRVGLKFFSKAEANEFVEFLATQPAEGKLAVAQQISAALGEDAYAVFSELDIKEAGVFTTAGRLMAENDPNTAKLLFQSEEYFKDNPSLVSEIKTDLERYVDAALGPAYEAQPQERRQLREAVVSLYAYQTRGERQVALDEDIADKAITALTGGLAEVGSSLVRVPYRGMPAAAFEDWVDRLTPYYIDKQGGTFSYTSDQVINRLQGGELTLLHTPVRGEYVLYDNMSGNLIHQKDGTKPFVLKYDALAPMNKIIKMGKFVDPGRGETLHPINPQLTQQDALLNMFGVPK